MSAESSFEKAARAEVDVRFRRPVTRALKTVVHGLEVGERVGLIEVDELALADFANERLAGERPSNRRACAARTRPPTRCRSGRRPYPPDRGSSPDVRQQVSPRRARRGRYAAPPCVTERFGAAPLWRCRG